MNAAKLGILEVTMSMSEDGWPQRTTADVHSTFTEIPDFRTAMSSLIGYA